MSLLARDAKLALQYKYVSYLLFCSSFIYFLLMTAGKYRRSKDSFLFAWLVYLCTHASEPTYNMVREKLLTVVCLFRCCFQLVHRQEAPRVPLQPAVAEASEALGHDKTAPPEKEERRGGGQRRWSPAAADGPDVSSRGWRDGREAAQEVSEQRPVTSCGKVGRVSACRIVRVRSWERV